MYVTELQVRSESFHFVILCANTNNYLSRNMSKLRIRKYNIPLHQKKKYSQDGENKDLLFFFIEMHCDLTLILFMGFKKIILIFLITEFFDIAF